MDGYTSVFATEVTPGEPGKKPVKIKLVDAKTKEVLTLLALLAQKYKYCRARSPSRSSV